MFLSVSVASAKSRSVSLRPEAAVEIAWSWTEIQQRLNSFRVSLGNERSKSEGFDRLRVAPVQEAIEKLFRYALPVERVDLLRFEPSYAPTRERCGVWIKEPMPALDQFTLLFRPYGRIMYEMELKLHPAGSMPRVLGDLQNIANLELQPPPEEAPVRPTRERTRELSQLARISSAIASAKFATEASTIALVGVNALICMMKQGKTYVSRSKAARLLAIAQPDIFTNEPGAESVIAQLERTGHMGSVSMRTKKLNMLLLSITELGNSRLLELGVAVKVK